MLTLLLFCLIFVVRLQQRGWQIELDLFPNLRAQLGEKISLFLPSPQAELLSGILLGEKKTLPPVFRLALRDTSTLHIVVVSGQNLSMVAGFFLMLSGLIKRKVAIALSFVAIIFYTLLTGADIPVLRAAVMVTFASIAQILGRQQDSIWVLAVTAALMLLINPAWITDLSFQLSFMATFGVLVVAPILLKTLRILPLVGQDLAVAIGAQIMVGPIIAANFHQFSLVGVVTNVLVGWTVPFIMILGTILLILSWISLSLGYLAALAVGALLTYFVYIIEFFASLPFAWEYVGEKLWIVWVGYYLVVVGVLMGISKLKSQMSNVKTTTQI